MGTSIRELCHLIAETTIRKQKLRTYTYHISPLRILLPGRASSRGRWNRSSGSGRRWEYYTFHLIKHIINWIQTKRNFPDSRHLSWFYNCVTLLCSVLLPEHRLIPSHPIPVCPPPATTYKQPSTSPFEAHPRYKEKSTRENPPK